MLSEGPKQNIWVLQSSIKKIDQNFSLHCELETKWVERQLKFKILIPDKIDFMSAKNFYNPIVPENLKPLNSSSFAG